MASGDGDRDDDGFCHSKRRCHGSDGAGSERNRVAAAAGDFTYDDDDTESGDDGAGDSMEDDDDYYDYEAYDDGGCIGEVDDTCDDEYPGDDEYAEEEETKAVKPTYSVLTEDMILARQEKETADMAEVLSIPSGFAAVLLRHFKWRASQAQDEWFSDDRRVRDAVGLPPPADDGGGVPVAAMAVSTRSLVCGICFGRFNAGRTRSAGCRSHYYCDACWRGYVHAAVADGARCLSLRCPDTGCSAAVVEDLVNAVADAADRARYARFALRSYVEQSGGGVKWCPAAGCTRALEFVGYAAGDGDGDGKDVFCACAHGFCWSCGEEAHRPVSCGTVRAWLAKNSSDSETANWVLTHTKHCPKCRRPIEKNHGCNHMTCGAPCRHQFCWLCFDPWDNHRGCTRFDYLQQQDVDGGAGGGGGKRGNGDASFEEERRRRRQAKASLDRYLYHYERWAGNGKSLQKALADMDELRSSGLEKMAGSLEIRVEDLEFLTMAYELIAYGRRVMRWVYAYGYYLDPERDVCKRNIFDRLQDDANRRLEDLHHAAEVERVKFCSGDAGSAMNEMYRAYREQLIGLTKVTRNYFGNLVKAFETDLPEISSVKNQKKIKKNS